MPRIYVALDTETTGLRPDVDAVIEVAAVRFQADRVLETFSSLVNPQRPIPLKIQSLTGISQAEVDKAPLATAVLPKLNSFLKDYPVVGHNIAADMGFLNAAGVGVGATRIDTFELASIILPKMASYNLELLTKALGIPPRSYHRALPDATLAKDLFLALFERCLNLDISTIQEIIRSSAKVDWPLKIVFQEIEQQKARAGLSGSIREQLAAKGLVGGAPWAGLQREQPLEAAAEKQLLDVDALATLLQPGGAVARVFPAYEHRPQQVKMLRAVANALNNDEHLIVEAGTGVGKSLAYLIPALAFALRNGKRVVVSTNTINLQDQLYNKDIPALQSILGAASAAGANLAEARAIMLKGRSNYLCTRRWNAFRQAEHHSAEEARLLAKIMVWLPTTLTGDRAELTLPTPEQNAAWSKIAADSESCNAETCQSFQKGQCFLHRARKAAEAAHIIIVNHALLLSDIATENRVLPEYRHLIVDEAHHLEDVATAQLGYHTDQKAILELFNRLSGPDAGERPTGLLAEIPTHFRNSLVPTATQQDIQRRLAEMHGLTQRARDGVYEFFNALNTFIENHGPESNSRAAAGYDQPLRLTTGMRNQPAWSAVDKLWDDLRLRLDRLRGVLNRLLEELQTMADQQILEYEDVLADLQAQVTFLTDLRDRGSAIVAKPPAGEITWLTVSGQTGDVGLHSAPLHVGPVLEAGLFSQKECVILTSATLATEGTFAYMRERLGLDEVNELLVGSPFDYKSAALMYLPTDLPEPGAPYYQKSIEKVLVDLCKATEGRALILLTSHSAVRSTYAAISRPLEQAGISVLGHGIDGTPRQVVERFKVSPRAVLLGTSSLWEGIDIVGDALSVLVIGRLPFSVPSDPIFSARSEVFDDAFNEYAVPQSVLRFKQGFGRLIRSKTDRGVVVVLDQRITSKGYGQAFLQSLPSCTVRRGSVKDLPVAAKAWLEKELAPRLVS